jgi:TP901 family phage tail tape measure protein
MADAKLQAVIDARDRTAGAFGSFNARIQASRNRIRGMGLAMSAMGAAMVGAMALSVKSFAAAGDEVQKMASRTGFSTEALSELRFAAQIAGTDIRSMEVGFRRMSSSIIDANAGLTESQRSFNQLGLEFTSLEGLSPEDAFLRITSALADVEDATLQVSLAQDIFGRSGTALLPLLEGGSEALQRLRAEASELGVVFSQETADQAAELNDQLTRLKTSMQGVVFVLAQVMVPAIDAVVGAITPVIVGFRQWAEEHETLARVVVIAAGVVGGLMLVLGPLALILPSLIAGFAAMAPVVAAVSLAMLGPVGLVIAVGLVGVALGILVARWIRGHDEMADATQEVIGAQERLSRAVSLTALQEEAASISRTYNNALDSLRAVEAQLVAVREELANVAVTVGKPGLAQLRRLELQFEIAGLEKQAQGFNNIATGLADVFIQVQERIRELVPAVEETDDEITKITVSVGELTTRIEGLRAARLAALFQEMGTVASAAAGDVFTINRVFTEFSGSLDDATEATKRAALSAAVQAGIVSDLASTYRVAITASELMGRTITSVMEEAEQAAALSGSSITDVLEGMMRAFKSVEEQAADSVDAILASLRRLSGGGGFTGAGFQQFQGGFDPTSMSMLATIARGSTWKERALARAPGEVSEGDRLLALSQAAIVAAAEKLNVTTEMLVDALNRNVELPVYLDGQRVGDAIGAAVTTAEQNRG